MGGEASFTLMLIKRFDDPIEEQYLQQVVSLLLKHLNNIDEKISKEKKGIKLFGKNKNKNNKKYDKSYQI